MVPVVARSADPSHPSPLPTKLPISPELSITEQLQHSTVQIISVDTIGKQHAATGFIFSMFNQSDRSVFVIVTNKHVTKGMRSAGFRMTKKTPDGQPDITSSELIPILDLEGVTLGHPDPEVDLAIVPLVNVLKNAGKNINDYFFKSALPTLIPTKGEAQSLDPVEEVLIVGYPSGISDIAHNLPIFRQGITASAANIEFQNTRQFLVDASIWPGSSGSPVYLFENGIVHSRTGTHIGETKLQLLGVVRAVVEPELDVVMPSKVLNTPDQDTGAVTKVPSNLGICVDADTILDFEPLLAKQGTPVPSGYVMRGKPLPS